MNGPKTASLVISAFVLVPIVAGAQVYVSVAPPPAIVEARAPSPGTGYLWIAGNWSWNGTRHVWRAGRWEQQPPAAARYVGPQWRRTGQGWRVDDGRWVNRRGATVTVDAATGQPPVAAAIQPPPTNVEVRLAPPAPITELQPNSPGNGYTWIPGFWNWDGRRYVWAAGHWEQPPNASAGATYTPHEWRREGAVFRFHAGQWNAAPAPAPTPVAAPATVANPALIATTPPPAPITEARGVAPGPGYAWISGYWTWNNSQYFWTGGHWEQQPTNAEAYEPPQWERDGNRYRFRQGRWRDRQGTTVMQAPSPQPVAEPPRLPRGRAPGIVIVTNAPPAPIAEFRNPSPGAGYTWEAGAWTWDGSQYQWAPGRWEAPPATGATWVNAQWVVDARGHRYQPGRWVDSRGLEVQIGVQPVR